jgi:tetratricopeptide (TPR) repeat protein
MTTQTPKNALVAAMSTKNQPHTQVAELRDLLTTLEMRVAKLKEISPGDALEILPLMDQARERLEALKAAGANASSEDSQFESLLLQLDKKRSVFLNRVGGPTALRQSRMERQPDKSAWWWFIDQGLAEERQSKIKRWAIIGTIVVALLIILVVVYNQFLAPSPEFQTGIGFQQTAESQLISGEYEEALTSVNQAIQYLPDYAELFVLRGVLYEILDTPDLAEQSYRLAREMSADEEAFYNVRAKYFLLAGLAESGMADAQKALSLNPDSAVSLMFIAQAYEMQGDISKAIEYYELASAAAEASNDPTLQVMARMQMATLLQQFNLASPEPPQE